jgi:hypothetical protein
MFAGPSWADQVYFQFGDGRVIRSDRRHWDRYRTQGAVIINTLPPGYVTEPYVYSGGYPVYYNESYWTRHHRHWGRGHGHHHHGHHHHHHGHY